jgi:predicted ribosomally synthesized peptide with SipW-like signal peptide
MKMRRSTVRAVVLCGVAAGVLLAGSSIAYLTDYDSAKNEFTVGKVEIELDEPGWVPEEHTKIVPGEDIKKNPQVTNTGVNDAFVYLQVSVPKDTVITADDQGNRLESRNQKLFSFESKEGWTQISLEESEDTAIYTYSYDKILEPEETTTALFDSVHFVNLIEGQLDEQSLAIPVRAYAIQSANTADEKKTVVEQAKEAYQKYIKQNAGQNSAVMENSAETEKE